MSSAEPRLRITAARAINRGNLIAIIDVAFGGLEIRDLTVLRGVHGLFVGMPRRPRVDQVGRQMRDENGKLLFDGPIVRWLDSGRAQEFQQACLATLRRDHPGILSGEADHHPQDDVRLLLDGLPTRTPTPRRPSRQRPPGRPWRADSAPPMHDDPVADLWPARGTTP